MTQEEKRAELFRTLKYLCFTFSAGVIQFVTTMVLSLIWPVEVFSMGPVLFYAIGLVLSVIWNLTINRKFTFKSAANLPIAMLKTIGFYIIFTPASCFLQGWLTNGVMIEGSTLVLNNYLGWPTLVGTIICMLVNLALEFPFQRFVVFGNSIDSAVKKDNVVSKEEQ